MGCLVASMIEKETGLRISDYLDRFVLLMEQGEVVRLSYFRTAWEILRWPLAALLVWFTYIGPYLLPLIYFLRGFLLTYAVSVLTGLFGWSGLALSGAVFGISALTSVTVLFLLGEELMNRKQSAGESGKKKELHLTRYLSFVLILLIGTLLHHWVSPILLNAVSAWLS